MFSVYLRLGFEHLLDLRAYDHLLFLAVLSAPYPPSRWRELLVLATAFTAGHSVSLALATVGWVRPNAPLVEFLILVTIAATAAANVAAARPRAAASPPALRTPAGARYAAALIFGVVHGLGFAQFLGLALGSERSLFVPLLSFNVGLELAQIAAVAVFLAVSFVATGVLRVPAKAWNVLLSVAGGAWAAFLATSRWPW